MKIEQIYTGCLAEAAYYIESNGKAAIIDPLREISPYIKKAEADNAKIKYIFETHFHADFVSGHVELAAKTGAQIVYGPNAECKFNCYSAKDGEEFKIGGISITVLHTPGHTLESSTFLLKDESGKPFCIFSGDTLFINDVGRPDLAVRSNLSKEQLAGLLYDSIQTKIMPLADDIIVYPGHGAGSACGKNLGKERFDTLGHQKKVNYALQPMSKEQFINEITSGQFPPPQYFPKNAAINKHGAPAMEDVYTKSLVSFSADEFEQAVEARQALILDTRDAQLFARGFIPGSINMGLGGQFASWVGTLINDLNQPLALVCEPGKEEEAIMRLARVGYDNTIGYLQGGFEAWKDAGKPADIINTISAEAFEKQFNENLNIIDVRRPAEFETEHISISENHPLDFINDWTGHLSSDKTYYIHCAGGYRSMVTTSILRARGFDNLVEIAGGYSAIAKTNVPKTNLVTSK